MELATTFETTYTRYPFAPLVAFGIAAAKALKDAGNTFGPAGRNAATGIIGGNRELAA